MKTEYINLSINKKENQKVGEICIVGAGVIGLYLATRLVSRGFDVILIEAGDRISKDSKSIGFEIEEVERPYSGTYKGRFFGIGGTASQWGGALIPHAFFDLHKDKNYGVWEYIVKIVEENSCSVLKYLGWKGKVDFLNYWDKDIIRIKKILDSLNIEIITSLHLPFRKKNMLYLLKKKNEKRGRLRIIYNAVVKEWYGKIKNGKFLVKEIVATSLNKNIIRVSASKFIICAGTIESTRILLEIKNSLKDTEIFKNLDIGHFLGDHLSLPIALISPESKDKIIRLFSPRFSKGWMRNFRFVEKDTSLKISRGFTHFIFEHENPGFVFAKKLLTGLQTRTLPKVSFSEMFKSVEGLIKLASHRFFKSRLYIPPYCNVYLQLDIEQAPSEENKIELSEKRDVYGRRIPRIKWNVRKKDYKNIYTTALHFLDKFKKAGIFSFIPLIEEEKVIISEKPNDIYHPVGTCRMGNSPPSVVNKNLQVYNAENLWVVSTAVLPSAGTANPTFTILCLAEKLIELL